MIVTAWSNGKPESNGSGYGIRISKNDRNTYFDRRWAHVVIVTQGNHRFDVNLSRSFWGSCIELRSRQIGIWFLSNGIAPWQKYSPSKLNLLPIRGNVFKIKR